MNPVQQNSRSPGRSCRPAFVSDVCRVVWHERALRAVGTNPLARAVLIVFQLPDRDALFELLDHVAAGVVRLAAMRMRDGDCHAGVSELELAEAMLDDDVTRTEAL